MVAVKKPASAPQAPRTLHATDFYTWCHEQAAALAAGRLDELDLENLAEEIASLGNEQFSKLTSAYRIVLVHMLKWDYQPGRRSRSWAGSIATQRIETEDVLADNPGLRPRIGEAVERAFRRARLEAALQMRVEARELPTVCPYAPDEIMARPFEWPVA